MNDNENPLRKFLQNLDLEKNWPDNYRESPIYIKGHQTGYMEGQQDAWAEVGPVIDSIRNILKLYDSNFEE